MCTKILNEANRDYTSRRTFECLELDYISKNNAEAREILNCEPTAQSVVRLGEIVLNTRAAQIAKESIKHPEDCTCPECTEAARPQGLFTDGKPDNEAEAELQRFFKSSHGVRYQQKKFTSLLEILELADSVIKFREDEIAEIARVLRRVEFEKAAEPLIKYLAENHHPHTSVHVTNVRAELSEGIQLLQTDKYDN